MAALLDTDDLQLLAAWRSAVAGAPDPLSYVDRHEARLLIEASGLTLAFSAGVLRIDPSTLSRWLAGTATPCAQYEDPFQRFLHVLRRRARLLTEVS